MANNNQVTFRLVCHVSRIGGLIGPQGTSVKNLQRLSNSRIWVEYPHRDSSTEDCVINVKGSPFLTRKINIPNVTQVYGEEDVWFDVSAAQEGMLRVFETVVMVAADGVVENYGLVCCQLLAVRGQVGSVIGVRGSVVDVIRRESGCKVCVLMDDKSSSWEFPNEDIVEIEGDFLGVKKAIIAVTGRLQEFPPPRVSNSFTNSFNYSYKALNQYSTKRQVVIMILCPSDLVGRVIGRGGSTISDIYRKSGATVNIEPPVDDCNERLIYIRAMEDVESQYSHVRHAAELVFNRIVESSFDTRPLLDANGTQVLARVVVPSNQVGWLVGKGGIVISQMRKATYTRQRLIRGDEVPKCAPEDAQILQITGEFVNVRNAISMVVDELRQLVSYLHASNASSSCDPLKMDSCNYNKVRFPPAPGLHKPAATSNNPNDLTQLSSVPTAASGVIGGIVMDDGGLPSSNGVELGRPAVVTNTTVEIALHGNVIGSIEGENGSNLDKMREISGAKVTLNEPQPGSTNRIIVISGSPEETQAAQSLLHAFILSGSS